MIQIDRNYLGSRKVRLASPYKLGERIVDGDDWRGQTREDAQRYTQRRHGRLSRLFEEHNSSTGRNSDVKGLQPFDDRGNGYGLWLDNILMSRGTPIGGSHPHIGLYLVELPEKFVRDGETRTNLLLNGSVFHIEGGVKIWTPGEVYPLNFGLDGEKSYHPIDLNPKTGFIEGLVGGPFKIKFSPGLRAVSLDGQGNVDATQLFTTPYERHYMRLVAEVCAACSSDVSACAIAEGEVKV
ncbi:MAG: hypothetical protein HY512_01775 [Candidatus Aenigmarchaeota archaeon]|nr:hypothetical protein [Candidatus Aenigmarchaeota archaeon]